MADDHNDEQQQQNTGGLQVPGGFLPRMNTKSIQAIKSNNTRTLRDKFENISVGGSSSMPHQRIGTFIGRRPSIDNVSKQPPVTNLPPLLEPSDLPVFRIENGDPDVKPTAHPILTVPEDIYGNHFYEHRHFNYTAVLVKENDKECYIISVLATPVDGKYRALKTTKKGHEEFHIPDSELPKLEKEKAILHFLRAKYPDLKIHAVRTASFIEDMLQVEKKHPQDNRRCMKLAVVYATAGQTTPADMFKNTTPSQGFWDFMDALGSKVDLATFEGYRGDMGKGGESYYTKWNDWEVMFHVAPMLNSQQHRGLIGNDIATIFFLETGCAQLDPRCVDQLGTVPQIFAAVQPYTHNEKTFYRLAFWNRVNIKPNFGPELPANHFFEDGPVKQYLLTKLANGYCRVFKCPPMNRLFDVPRGNTINELVAKYPKESKQEAKMREKLEIQERAQLRRVTSKEQRRTLTVEVMAGRNLAPKDANGYSDPYCKVTIKEQSFETQIIKKTLNPEWRETFTFDLIGLNPATTDLHFTCMDWDRIGAHDFMGVVTIPLSEVKKYVGKETWLPLVARGNERVSGEVLIKLSMTDTF